jgi:glycerophosphoryl diester phosphodiesterase
LERTTNGHGFVSETADSLLFALDAGGGEPVPRFADAAALCCKLGLLANIEIKPAAGHEVETARRVAEMTAKLWHDARVQPLISSFSLEALEIARDLAPNISRGILCETVTLHWLDEMRRLQAMTLHCHADSVSDAVLAEAAAQHIPVLCYTVNAEKQAKNLLERGVSAMFSDRLDLFASEASL